MKSRTWIITDTHLGHDKMVEFCGRPADHSEKILAGLSKNIKEGDTLIHLGDVCIGNDVLWHERLTAAIPQGVRRILVKGNHDGKSDHWYEAHGWDLVCNSFVKKYFGKYIIFSHSPIPKAYRDIDFNVHGHFHNNDHRSQGVDFYDPEHHKLLAIENTHYLAVPLESLLK